MKTAQSRRDEARQKELELAAAKGITPEDVKDGENPPAAAAAPPADPPATPTPPATPPPVPDKPAETPPAQDQPPAATDGSPQPPAGTDYKAVAEQERASRIKVEAANEELRSKFNRELTERQKLELQNRVLQIGVGAGQPPAAAPAGNDAAAAQPPPGPPLPSMVEIEAEIKKASAELSDQAGDEIASRLSTLSQLHAKHAAASVVHTALNTIQQRYDPVLESAQADIRQNAADAQEVRYVETRKVIFEAYPNWESIVNSEPFQTWVANHPMAYQYQLGLHPGDSGMGFTPEGVVKVLAEFTAQDPTLQATVARDAEAAAREAAAAQNEGAAISTTPVIDNFGEGPKVLRSEFIRQSQEMKNNIPELNALVARMDKAVASGNFVDDLSR